VQIKFLSNFLNSITMKKKIFIAMATLFFAAIAFYNVQVTQHNGDISLEHVALMAQANGEWDGGGGISCHQHALAGRCNQCWQRDYGFNVPYTEWCNFSGYTFDFCCI
jgi:hypothetical protein